MLAAATEPFWRTKSLDEMSVEEWESLCDGCGQCCRLKLEDVETGDVVHTDIACQLLDLETCGCVDYAARHARVPACLRLAPETVASFGWLPSTCAYRRLARGHDLLWWHPLVSGDPETVHVAGISVRGQVVSESSIEDLDAALVETYGLEVL